jgi:hypothetical protein
MARMGADSIRRECGWGFTADNGDWVRKRERPFSETALGISGALTLAAELETQSIETRSPRSSRRAGPCSASSAFSAFQICSVR